MLHGLLEVNLPVERRFFFILVTIKTFVRLSSPLFVCILPSPVSVIYNDSLLLTYRNSLP